MMAISLHFSPPTFSTMETEFALGFCCLYSFLNSYKKIMKKLGDLFDLFGFFLALLSFFKKIRAYEVFFDYFNTIIENKRKLQDELDPVTFNHDKDIDRIGLYGADHHL